MFDLQLFQAINEWQRGGSQKQKAKRGKALKTASIHLPEKFRSISSTCYRRIALDKKYVWIAGTKYQLKETISSWTECLDVAKDFKGGVPLRGYQGALFCIHPGIGSVVVNLAALFKDQDFIEQLEKTKNCINDFDKGFGKYGSSQQEVVIETDVLPLNSLYAWGGYTSSVEKLATLYFSKKPTQHELQHFKNLMALAGQQAGPRWLTTPEAVARVNEKLKYHGNRLAEIVKSGS